MEPRKRRKARCERIIDPPAKVILSKNRGKYAQFNDTGQVEGGHPSIPPLINLRDLGFYKSPWIQIARNTRIRAPHLPRIVDLGAFGAKKRQHAAILRAKRFFRRRNGVQAARNNNQIIGTGKLPSLIACFLETLRLYHWHIRASASGALLTQNRS